MSALRGMLGTSAVAVIMGALILPPAQAAGTPSGEQVIKNRINFMDEQLYGEFKVLAAYVRTGKASLADVEKSARAIGKLSKEIPKHFPKDTGRGHYPDTMTRSLPVIWTDWAGFEKEVQRLVDGSERLARAASAGDKEQVMELIGPKGSYNATKIGCAECHDAYRGERVKR
jgi:cytochrome c556